MFSYHYTILFECFNTCNLMNNGHKEREKWTKYKKAEKKRPINYTDVKRLTMGKVVNLGKAKHEMTKRPK